MLCERDLKCYNSTERTEAMFETKTELNRMNDLFIRNKRPRRLRSINDRTMVLASCTLFSIFNFALTSHPLTAIGFASQKLRI